MMLDITTMYYNNGKIFTNHWLTWTGNLRFQVKQIQFTIMVTGSKKMGKSLATGAYMDTQWYFNEIGKYLETK